MSRTFRHPIAAIIIALLMLPWAAPASATPPAPDQMSVTVRSDLRSTLTCADPTFQSADAIVGSVGPLPCSRPDLGTVIDRWARWSADSAALDAEFVAHRYFTPFCCFPDGSIDVESTFNLTQLDGNVHGTVVAEFRVSVEQYAGATVALGHTFLTMGGDGQIADRSGGGIADLEIVLFFDDEGHGTGATFTGKLVTSILSQVHARLSLASAGVDGTHRAWGSLRVSEFHPGPGVAGCYDSLQPRTVVCNMVGHQVFEAVEDTPLVGSLASADGLGFERRYAAGTFLAPGGTLALTRTGEFVFVPAPNFHGRAGFTVETSRASDPSWTIAEGIAFDVAPVNDLPIAVPVAPALVTFPDTILLDGAASFDIDGPNDIISHVWDGIGPGETRSVGTSMTDLGFRTYDLRVTDAAGASSMATTEPIYVNARPLARIVAAPSVLVGAPLALDGSASFDPNPDGAVVAHAWSIDGQPLGADPSVSQSFATFGWRNATLDVRDDRDTTGSARHAFYVNAPPNARASFGAARLDGRASTEPDTVKDSIARYNWSFGPNGANPSFPFPAGRDRCGTLTVTDRFGATDTSAALCLPEAEARARAVQAPGESTPGVSRDAMGSTSTTNHPTATESADILWGANDLLSVAQASFRGTIAGSGIQVDGVHISAVARWSLTTGAATIAVDRHAGVFRVAGSPVAIPLPSEPATVPLADGGRLEMWQGELEQTDAGITYREDVMRVYDAAGALVAVYGSVLVQAGTDALEAPQ